jgi:hypothetical protein
MDGPALRDAGIARVMENNDIWAHEVERAFRYWLAAESDPVFTFEQFRVWATSNGLGEPHHPNAWGGLTKRFKHFVQPVGYTTSERPEAHARLTRTYTRKTHHHGI